MRTTRSEPHRSAITVNSSVAEASVELPWVTDADRVLEQFSVDPKVGLSAAAVADRQRRFGLNNLRSTKSRSAIKILFDQFGGVVIYLLVGAASLSFLFGDLVEGFAIIAVVVINTAIGFFTELRAIRSMEALRRLGRVETRVRRAGTLQNVAADVLVPGDIVLIEGGDVITADMRLIEASKLQADESALTGESLPIGKNTAALIAETHLADRSNMLFKGTAITRGAGEAVVVGTGYDTELGRISALVDAAQPSETPLEKRLDTLGRRLVWATLLIATLIAGIGLLAGRDALLAIEVAIALAVAAIPEGLPIVATIALARGMWRMAKRNALVSKLSAVETLGATGVILTDKTGTLTENRMTLSALELAGAGHLTVSGSGLSVNGTFRKDDGELQEQDVEELKQFLMALVLCNNAAITVHGDDASAVGDPTEVALLVAAAKQGVSREAILRSMPEVREEPFSAESQMMATFNRVDATIAVSVKGAPEAVVQRCVKLRTVTGDSPLEASQREAWQARAAKLAESGLRLLAVATKTTNSVDDDPFSELTLLGVLGLMDPPRDGVADALAACRDAGIKVVMVTGDHLATACSIGKSLHMLTNASSNRSLDAQILPDFASASEEETQRILQAEIIARATPKQKIDLIEIYQNSGNVVAMTGDGVNDAPALKQADIGVAMGIRGTQVAKEAAAMVLQDDEFATIVTAVAQGRAIYANIRKFVIYLLSCNISEILIVGLATAAGAPLPLMPLQILFLNLVTDVFPALALGVGEGSVNLMKQKPRGAKEALLTGRHWATIVAYGSLMSFAVLGAMFLAIRWLELDTAAAVTVSFLTLALAQLWHVFNMREQNSAWVRNEIVRNLWVWGAIILCLCLLLMAVYLPGARQVLSLEIPTMPAWGIIMTMSLLPLLLGPLARRLAMLDLRRWR